MKMPCHLLLSKLAIRARGNVLAALDSLSKPLEKTLTVRLKTDAVKQEVQFLASPTHTKELSLVLLHVHLFYASNFSMSSYDCHFTPLSIIGMQIGLSIELCSC